jgi:hypothetical protein
MCFSLYIAITRMHPYYMQNIAPLSAPLYHCHIKDNDIWTSGHVKSWRPGFSRGNDMPARVATRWASNDQPLKHTDGILWLASNLTRNCLESGLICAHSKTRETAWRFFRIRLDLRALQNTTCHPFVTTKYFLFRRPSSCPISLNSYFANSTESPDLP